MSEITLLTPLMNIQLPGTQSRVATQLTMLLQETEARHMLQQRYLYGTLRQYSVSPKQSFEEFARLRTNTKTSEMGAFVLRIAKGNETQVIGLASVQPSLELRKYREMPVLGAVPLPPRLVHRTPLVKVQPTVGAAVEAWTVPGYADELEEAYRQLSDPNGIAKELHTDTNSWTVEPKDAPNWVRSAIQKAGFTPVKTGHFEHDQSRMETPPLAVLYQRHEIIADQSA